MTTRSAKLRAARTNSSLIETLESRQLLAFSALIDFQPPSVPTQKGYVADTGAAFGNRGNGMSYGWNATNNNGIDRNSKKSPNQAYDTFNQMQKGGNFSWELAVPNGTYDVKIFAGDAVLNSTDFYHILAEGKTAVSGRPSTAQLWIGSNQPINVTDGRLTISNGANGVNNKIAFIEVRKAVPSIPTGLTATAVSKSQINLTWTDNAINEDGFVLERNVSSNIWQQVATLTANTTSFSDTGLSAGTRYTYQIRAFNDVGQSQNSFAASATTLSDPALAPAAPTGLAASGVSSSFATLTWTDNSNNEDKFIIQRIFSSSSFENYQEVPANTTSASVYLLSGNTNQLRVVAKNSGGVSDPSNAITIFTKPQAPVYANAQAASSTAIDISWDSLDACVFHVERLDNGTAGGVWTRIASDLGALSYRDANLTPGTSYSYRIIAAAVNSAGDSDPSDVVTATTAPSAVTGLAVTGVTSSSVALRWNDVTGEDFYRVERSLDGVNWEWVAYLYADTTNYTVTDLSSHTTYQFRVTGMAYGYAAGDLAPPVTATTA